MNISIIIPTYNEEKRIGNTIEQIQEYVKDKFDNFEIIVVDDCSEDRTTAVVKSYKNVTLLVNDKNMGKGYSVRKGFLCAKYDLVLFTDADLATPIEELEKLLNKIFQGYDISIASRNLKESKIVVQQQKYRQLMGKTFPLIVRALVLPDFKDTQCGFKLFKNKAAKQIAQKQRINRFAFDVEMLLIAKKNGFKIVEVPVIWIDKKGSTVKPIRDASRMMMDLVRIKVNDFSGKYQIQKIYKPLNKISSHV